MTKEEYEKRFAENQKVTGFGFETSISVPCPFCAAPGWTSWRIIDMRETTDNKECICSECGRGAKMLYTEVPGGLSFEFVQTCGDDPPDFLPPMRRVPSDTKTTSD